MEVKSDETNSPYEVTGYTDPGAGASDNDKKVAWSTATVTTINNQGICQVPDPVTVEN